MNELTDSQQRLLAAMQQIISAPILAEIQALREENDRLHQRERDDKNQRFRRDVKRHALGLLRLVGMSDKEIDEWMKKK